MIRNRDLRFICRFVDLLVKQADTPFTTVCRPKQVLRMPISHFEGNYYIDEAGLRSLVDNNQIVLKYCDADGKCTPQSNPNGATFNIAGICNRDGTVFGLMPHPERVFFRLTHPDWTRSPDGAGDGRAVIESVLEYVSKKL